VLRGLPDRGDGGARGTLAGAGLAGEKGCHESSEERGVEPPENSSERVLLVDARRIAFDLREFGNCWRRLGLRLVLLATLPPPMVPLSDC